MSTIKAVAIAVGGLILAAIICCLLGLQDSSFVGIIGVVLWPVCSVGIALVDDWLRNNKK